MKKIAAYLIPVLACFAVGISASFFQASSIAEWYPTLTKPTLTPPNIVFPIAWSVLYLCMGLSLGRLIVRRQHKGIIRLWVLQLIANFLWSILFFTLRNPLAGFIDIVLLNILVGLVIDHDAAALLAPVLQGIKRVIRQGGHVGRGLGIHAEDAALLVDVALLSDLAPGRARRRRGAVQGAAAACVSLHHGPAVSS